MNREDIIRMAKEAECGITLGNRAYFFEIDELEAFAKLVAAAERTECAKICDELADAHGKMDQWGSYKTADVLAQAIRARG